jgi:hypothetical protein
MSLFSISVLLPFLWAGAAIYVANLAFNWRKLLLSPDVSATTWNAAMTFIGFGILGFLYFVCALAWWREPWHAALSIPLILLGFFGWYLATMPLTKVSSDPPEVGLLTFWGKRLEVILGESEYLLPTFWPFKIGVSTATAKTIIFDFSFNDVPCKSDTSENGKGGVGALVKVRVVGSIEADHMLDEKDSRGDKADPCEGARRVIKFLNKGGNDGLHNGDVTDWKQNGVLRVLEGVIGQGVREQAKGYTWEEYVALKAPLAATLIASISTARPRKLPENSEGVVTKPDHQTFTPAMYMRLPVINEPLVYVCSANGSDEEGKKKYRNRITEMEFFLEMIREGGFADVPDLGIQFTRFTVPEIESTDAVKEATDKAAAEKKQREQQMADHKTQIDLAQLYVKAEVEHPGTKDALLNVRLRENPGTTETIIRGSGSSLTDAAAIFADGNKKQGG